MLSARATAVTKVLPLHARALYARCTDATQHISGKALPGTTHTMHICSWPGPASDLALERAMQVFVPQSHRPHTHWPSYRLGSAGLTQQGSAQVAQQQQQSNAAMQPSTNPTSVEPAASASTSGIAMSAEAVGHSGVAGATHTPDVGAAGKVQAAAGQPQQQQEDGKGQQQGQGTSEGEGGMTGGAFEEQGAHAEDDAVQEAGELGDGEEEQPPVLSEEELREQQEKLQAADALKQEGNQLYGQGRFAEAAEKYMQAIDAGEGSG